MSLNNIKINDPVEFTENCTSIGAIKCRANKIPGKVIGIQGSKHTTYLVDVGLGYCIYVGVNDIKPFKSGSKKEEVRSSEKEVVCKI